MAVWRRKRTPKLTGAQPPHAAQAAHNMAVHWSSPGRSPAHGCDSSQSQSRKKGMTVTARAVTVTVSVHVV
eukprot:scaffold1053_cov107-Isochrysis_galbana.AAC.17